MPFCFKTGSALRTSHYLLLVSKNFLGYDIMKRIMAKESTGLEQGVASFGYCEADERFPRLFELGRPLDELGERLCSDLAGRRLNVGNLYKEHSVGTPYTSANYKQVLLKLEEAGRIIVHTTGPHRRRGTMADKLEIQFPNR